MPLVSMQKTPVEAASEQITEPKDLWARQKNEPASLYLEFTAYRLLGRKRSLQALIESKAQEKKAPESTANAGKSKQKTGKSAQIQEVKTPVPGHIKAACKKWKWVERAQAWDLHRLRLQEEIYDRALKDGTVEYASSFRRILELNTLVKAIEAHMEKVTSFQGSIVCVKTIQSLLAQIASEMQARKA